MYSHTGRSVIDPTMAKGAIMPKNSLFLPVLRTEKLFHRERNPKYCGTFYYIESESRTLLDLGNTLIVATKWDAYLKLLDMQYDVKMSNRKRDRAIDHFLRTNSVAESLNYYLSENFTELDSSEMIEEFNDKTIKDLMFKEDVGFYRKLLNNNGDNSKVYIDSNHYFTYLYPTDENNIWNEGNFHAGIHDWMDQPICTMAAELGYDTVIFQREIAKTIGMDSAEAVSEILDVRANSYEHLYNLSDSIVVEPWKNFNPNYPTVWFKDYGLIQSGDLGELTYIRI